MKGPWRTSREPESALRRLALLPLSAASRLVEGGARIHRFLYERGVLGGVAFPGHVLSVGGLSVGGSGKTPLAAWIAAALRDRGRRVALLSRGYGRRGREKVVVVSDGRFVRGRIESCGDEPMLLAGHAAGVPVLVGRDRSLADLRALSAFGSELLVLDDGFQHHRLKRRIDVVALDGGQGFGNRRLLPRGPLREPLRALRCADALAIVDGPLPREEESILDRYAPLAYRVAVRRRPVALHPLVRGAPAAASSIGGLQVGLLSGIARPESFRATVEGLGASVVAERIFPDHHRYRERDLFGLRRLAPLWITTEKDAIKILPSWVNDLDLFALILELDVDSPRSFLDWLESQLR